MGTSQKPYNGMGKDNMNVTVYLFRERERERERERKVISTSSATNLFYDTCLVTIG